MSTSKPPVSPESPRHPVTPARGRKRAIASFVLVALGAAGASAVAAIVLVSVTRHKEEQKNPFYRVVHLDDSIDDPAVWGKNFPLQYDGYRRTVDSVRTNYGGSEALPREPTGNDPRTFVARSKIEEDPRFKRMWAGYAFAVDFREERGHAHMLQDQTYTERQHVTKQPGTCIHCHASTYVAMQELGKGDLVAGFEALNQMPYAEARKHVEHPVSCIDCHDPSTMALRITRPAFVEGIRAAMALEGRVDFDIARDATRQEMRSYVCGQCHVEYYFKGPDKRLTYPWAKGRRADDILAYYEEEGFSDWTHAETGAGVLKAQHPEFEMYSQGIHARSGVACADCHMPYKREGAMKISDHHVRSPLLNIDAACQGCHHFPESEMLARVDVIQRRHVEMRDRSLDALIDLIDALGSRKAEGASDDELAEARSRQRKAQFLLDFAEAENSSGFHAPQEAARVLGLSLDHTRRGMMALAGQETAED
jgi:nitrite reductase (cytochrome c-552)